MNVYRQRDTGSFGLIDMLTRKSSAFCVDRFHRAISSTVLNSLVDSFEECQRLPRSLASSAHAKFGSLGHIASQNQEQMPLVRSEFPLCIEEFFLVDRRIPLGKPTSLLCIDQLSPLCAHCTH